MTISNLIDAHTHIWTPDLTAYPLASGFTQADMKPPSFTPEEFMQHASPCGVERAVLIQMSFHGLDNSYVLDAIREAPQKFVGVAVVDENSEDLGGQLETLRARGIVGLRLVTLRIDADSWVDSQSAKNVFREAADQKIAACFLCNPGELSAIDRVCSHYPELTVVIDHLARIGAGGDINEAHISQLINLSRHKNVYVKVSAFYALGKQQPPYLDFLPMIHRLRDAYGAERLMWASDCPFQLIPGHTYRDSIELITERANFLSAEEKLHLLQGTAEQVFFDRASSGR
ncbi:MAG: amidohydrolase [Planctomycetaceae bacterium]|nr:amidohydrolase [Planctomycetaceae bacterium]